MLMKNLVGLVSGGASGLGKATVERFVREGAKVAMLDLPTSDGKAVADKLGSDNCCFVACDITKEDEVAKALEETKGVKMFFIYGTPSVCVLYFLLLQVSRLQTKPQIFLYS